MTEEENCSIIAEANLFRHKKKHDTSVNSHQTVCPMSVQQQPCSFSTQIVHCLTSKKSFQIKVHFSVQFGMCTIKVPNVIAVTVSLVNQYGLKELNFLLSKLGLACTCIDLKCLPSHLFWQQNVNSTLSTYSTSDNTCVVT